MTTLGEWSHKVPGEMKGLTKDRWILMAARQQKETPQEWFRRAA